MLSRSTSSTSSSGKSKKRSAKSLTPPPFWMPSKCSTASVVATERCPYAIAAQKALWQDPYATTSRVNVFAHGVGVSNVVGPPQKPNPKSQRSKGALESAGSNVIGSVEKQKTGSRKHSEENGSNASENGKAENVLKAPSESSSTKSLGERTSEARKSHIKPIHAHTLKKGAHAVDSWENQEWEWAYSDVLPEDKVKGKEGEDWVWIYDETENDEIKSPKKGASSKASGVKAAAPPKDHGTPKKLVKMTSILRSRRGKRPPKKGAMIPPEPRKPDVGITFTSETEAAEIMSGRDTGAGFYHASSMDPLDDQISRIILDEDPELSKYYSVIKGLDGIETIIKDYETTKAKDGVPVKSLAALKGKASGAKEPRVAGAVVLSESSSSLSDKKGSDQKCKNVLPNGTKDKPVGKDKKAKNPDEISGSDNPKTNDVACVKPGGKTKPA